MRTSNLEMMTARVTATALLTEVLLHPGAVTATVTPSTLPQDAECQFTAPVEVNATRALNLNVAEPQELNLREPDSEWTKRMERRFEELSISEAVGTLKAAEISELQNLTKERRRLHHPRTAEEILFAYRQRKVTSDLVKAVQEYVNFHNVPHPARVATR